MFSEEKILEKLTKHTELEFIIELVKLKRMIW